MDPVILSRLQFAITTVYHFFFVPLTLGLGWVVAVLETMYVRSGDEVFLRLTKFWGKLFLINFAMGVVTGIVQEFQFGMNWSEYSRYVGDIFGAPLAIEALMAFFLESTFLGIWLFGWDRLSRKAHAATIWLVAIGSNLSALWILLANGFMQDPVGFTVRNGRAEMVDFIALITNPRGWYFFWHTISSGLVTAAFFILGISAYHILRKQHSDAIQADAFKRTFVMAGVIGLIATLSVVVSGHLQGDYVREVQPMAAAASESHWNTQDPAAFSVVAFFDPSGKIELWSLKIPKLLSFLYYFKFSGEVEGINQIQARYEEAYGPGNYIPVVGLAYWTFRIMVGVGFLMVAVSALALYLPWKKWPAKWTPWIKWLVIGISLPYIANTCGWVLTESARQPWIVTGLLKTEAGVSPLQPGVILASLLGYTLLYAALMVADVFLLVKYAKAGLDSTGAETLSYADDSGLAG
jgi:cytochrome d ubiquinol oxidase subunit I